MNLYLEYSQMNDYELEWYDLHHHEGQKQLIWSFVNEQPKKLGIII